MPKATTLGNIARPKKRRNPGYSIRAQAYRRHPEIISLSKKQLFQAILNRAAAPAAPPYSDDVEFILPWKDISTLAEIIESTFNPKKYFKEPHEHDIFLYNWNVIRKTRQLSGRQFFKIDRALARAAAQAGLRILAAKAEA